MRPPHWSDVLEPRQAVVAVAVGFGFAYTLARCATAQGYVVWGHNPSEWKDMAMALCMLAFAGPYWIVKWWLNRRSSDGPSASVQMSVRDQLLCLRGSLLLTLKNAAALARKRDPLQTFLLVFAWIGFVNLAIFLFMSATVGNALSGYAADGHFYLGVRRGTLHVTEVSLTVWKACLLHSASQIVLVPLALLARWTARSPILFGQTPSA